MKGKSKKIVIAFILLIIAIISAILSTIVVQNVDNRTQIVSPELLKARTYDRVNDNDTKVNEYVTFSSFFIRDLESDSNVDINSDAEKLLGTCRNVNSTDVLYMDLNVKSQGRLENAKIKINGSNFNYSMSMVADSVLKKNYISDDVTEIELNTVNPGTQKLIMGNILADLNNDTNNYSGESTVTLTGTYVSDSNEKTEINKEIKLTVDWYGTTATSLYTKNSATDFYYDYKNLDTTTISFSFRLDETQEELILKDNVATVTVPDLNGCPALRVVCTNDNVDAKFDENTKVLTLTRSSVCDEHNVVTNSLARKNTYSIDVEYPKEAFDRISSYTLLKLPITGYYTGYNNADEELTQNPYQSNEVSSYINLIFRDTPNDKIYNFDVDFADKKYVIDRAKDDEKNYRYVISKQDLINLYDSDEEIKNKEYTVRWLAIRGPAGEVTSMEMAEKKDNDTYCDKWDSKAMDDYVTNTGVYFAGADTFLNEDGVISIYNADTNALIKELRKDEWNDYSKENPFEYTEPVKHIKVVTTNANLNSTLSVYNVKQLDVSRILTDFSKDELRKVNVVYTHLTGVCNMAENKQGKVDDIDSANYVSEKSYAELLVDKDKISTQETSYNQKIEINAKASQEGDAKWQNGQFLVEIPQDIINMEINDVTSDNENVEIVARDLYQKDGQYFIKIITSNDQPETYKITIDCNMTPDPRKGTENKEIKLYSYNQLCNDYYREADDTYDVDDDNNTSEKVGEYNKTFSLLSPTSLLTMETITNYDDGAEEEITIAPNIADVEKDAKTATVNIELTNNYPNTVSGAIIVGRIPCEENTYILNTGDLGSKFSTTMTDGGITLPEELKQNAKIYYSTNAKATNDMLDESNGWTLSDEMKSLENVKSYLIDFGESTIDVEKPYTISYNIKIPDGIDYNLASYANHAVYYQLNTNGGKLQLSTEPNRVGVRIVKKFDLELTKVKKSSELAIPGVTYSLKYKEENAKGILEDKTRILTTNTDGKISLPNLYVGKEYTLQEIKVPETCELNSEKIIFTVDKDGKANVTGTVKEQSFEAEKTLKIKLEDEIKYNVEINKTKAVGSLAIDNVRFRLEDDDKNVKFATTENGKATFIGLSLNKTYTLTETSAPVTCEVKSSNFKFKLVRKDGTIQVEKSGDLVKDEIHLENPENELNPMLKLSVQNEITYALDLTKQDEDGNPLGNVQFTIKGEGFSEEGSKYTTSKEGKLSIYGLSLGETYTLKEVKATGYYLDPSKDNEIEFKVERDNGELKLTTTKKSGVTDATSETDVTDEPEETGAETSTNENTIKITQAEISEHDLEATLTMVLQNEKIPTYDLKLVKVNDKGEQLKGAQFKLKSVDTEEEKIVEVDDKGEIVIEDLFVYDESKNYIKGEYTLEETFAPEGYILNKKQIKFKAKKGEDEKLKLEITDGSNLVKETTEDGVESEKVSNGEAQTKVAESTETIESDGVEETEIQDKSTDKETLTLQVINKPIFQLKKYGDNNQLLPGAKFAITKMKEGSTEEDKESSEDGVKDVNGQQVGEEETIDGNEYKNVVTTNDKGELSIDLPEGLYKVVEIQAPEGYELPKSEEERTHYFGIGKSQPEEREEEPDVLKYAKSISMKSQCEYESAVATDDGGVIVVGTVTIDGGQDGIVVKYDKDGNEQWTRLLNGLNRQKLYSIAKVPNDGGYVIAGSTHGANLFFDGTKVETEFFGNTDGILIKIDKDGTYQWCQCVGGTGNDRINSVAVSESSEVAVTGSYTSTELYTGKETKNTLSNAGSAKHNKNAFIIVYSLDDGGYKWSNNIGGTEDTVGPSITCVNSTFVVGINFIGNMKLNSEEIKNTNAYYADCIIIAYNGSDDIAWKKQIGSSQNDNIKQVTTDNEGNILVTGSFGGAVNANGLSFSNSGRYDGMIIKYDQSGNYQKSATIAGTLDDIISTVVQTEEGDYLIGGYTYSPTVTINGEALNNQGNCDAFVAELEESDSGFKIKWSDTLQGDGYDVVSSVLETEDKGYVAVGDFTGSTIDIFNENDKLTKKTGIDSLTENSHTDSLIVKYEKTITAPEVPQAQELKIHNELKQYRITTEIGADSEGKREGGKITGTPITEVDDYIADGDDEEGDYNKNKENINFVENVKYGYSNQTPIVITPEKDYYVLSVKINDKEVLFDTDENGEVTLPKDYFGNVTENKHIVVTFISKEKAVKIIKQDTEGERLAGATFKIKAETKVSEDNGTDAEHSSTGTASVETLANTEETGKEKKSTEVAKDGQTSGTESEEKEAEKISSGKQATEDESKTEENDQDTAEGEEGCITVTTNNQGEAIIALANGNYIIEEIKAPEHYIPLEEPIRITIPNDKEIVNKVENKDDTDSDGADTSSKENTDQASEGTEESGNPTAESGEEGQTSKKSKDSTEGTPSGTEEDVDDEVPDGNKEVNYERIIVIENKKMSKVIVHHYLKEGNEYKEESVAPDETLEGVPGKEYVTSPKKIEDYTLETKEVTDEETQETKEEYVVPENASGKYKEGEDIVVKYYYTKTPLDVTVHHYLEGTQDELQDDEHKKLQKGEDCEVNPSEEVLKKYEVVEVLWETEKDDSDESESTKVELEDSNNKVTVENIEKNVEVTYYYRIKKRNITTKVEVPEGRDEKGGEISGEGLTPYEVVDYEGTSKEDIIITPEKGYRAKQIKVVSTDEDGHKTESVIYGENADEDAEIKYTKDVNGYKITLDKFKNMTQDKEVIVVFEPDEGRVIVHHYIENSIEKITDDQIMVGLVGTEVHTSPVKKENYVLVKEPEDRDATITKHTQEMAYYYQRQYTVTTDIIKYEEPNEEGEMEEVVGGTISGNGLKSYEDILKGRDSTKKVEIEPNDGFQIVQIKINDKDFDYSGLLQDDGSVTLPEGFFKNVDEDKHIEVEFRRKTKVHVKYYAVKTETEPEKELLDEEIIEGYVGKDFETSRKNIPNYKASELGTTDTEKRPIEPNGQMTKDEITIIYWYEKVPAGILVKYVEKITTKSINEETGEEEITITANVLDEEVILGYAGNEQETTRKTFENYIPSENKDAKEGINVLKDENSKTATFKEDEVVEVIYWYEREFKITTDVIEHTETIDGEEVKVKGGSITGEDADPFEKVVRANDSIEDIEIVPESGYRIKRITINDTEVYFKDKLEEDGSLTLDKFTNVQEDKSIKVEFEKIKAKVVVEYKDNYTKESIQKDTIIDGYVNDTYNAPEVQIEGYVLAEPMPQNSNGTMTEQTIVVTYWYAKQFKITTDVKEHEELSIKDDPYSGRMVKGGSITGEDETPYETVLRGDTSKNPIIMTPEKGYRIKSVIINGEQIEIKDLVKQDNSLELPYFTDVQEDKVIVVEYEKLPAVVQTQYLEEGTENQISEPTQIEGNLFDKYVTEPKDIEYYELVQEKYPQNNRGTMAEENTIVKYYYRKLPFNFKIEKEVESVTLNGDSGSKQVDLSNKKQAKVEIKYKDISSTNLEVTYKIMVTNTEKISGTAIIEELIPQGFTFVPELSDQNWQFVDGKYVLTTEEINPNETKEYIITLRWYANEQNNGEKPNTARIIATQNIPNYDETNMEDNADNAMLQIIVKKSIKDIIDGARDDFKNGNVKTGDTIIISVITVVLAGAVILIINKKKN